ncbi:MAG TPA: ABC transporter permease [Puia sp.]|nr:ABC transporter permease [Puia sp.]
MLRNYLKVALRNLWKSKGFTAINIIGLASGLAVCLLIVLYVVDEIGFDRYNVNADRIYRLDADIFFNNTHFNSATSPKPLPVALVNECPQVENMARITYFGNQSDVLIRKGGSWIQDHHLAFADSTLFKVFTIPLIAGDPATALTAPGSIVIDESAAVRYFNNTDVVGKTLELGDKTLCKITAVFRDLPRQSHFHFSFFRPLRDSHMDDEDKWLNNSGVSYILVRPGTNRAQLQRSIDAIAAKYLGRELDQQMHITARQMKQQGSYFRYRLMPVTDIHLHSNKSYEFEPGGNIGYVYIFSCIAILILVIACVNFMNLSTARSAGRAKEVGIRKVAGSTKGHLVVQFLTESILLSLFSLVLALGIAVALLPMFNSLSGKELQPASLFSIRFSLLLLGLAVTVGFLAGSYPAFYLSSFQPIAVLKGRIVAGFRGGWLRSSLVVFQFFISIGLIISTLVIYTQLNYIRNRSVGFDRDQVLIVHNAYTAGDRIKTLRKEMTSISGVADASLSGDMPTQGGGYNEQGWWRSPTIDATSISVFTTVYIDDHYIPTLGMQIVKGRNFSADHPTDSTAVILNEAAVALLGWKDPLRERLWSLGDSMKPIPHPVVGVVKDFNFSSMHDKIGPMVLTWSDSRGSMAIRLSSGNVYSLVNQIEAKWKNFSPGLPFSYTFMDDDFNKLYHAEEQTGRVFITFAVFAILIASLGLFGLVTYAAEQRTKEIGIRKVLGARVTGIVGLLSRDFTRLVLIAALIAFPVAWWVMNRWLQSFAYRVGISWWIFVVAGAAAFFIALITVSFQTIRAAVANPVKSLRSE